MSAYYTETELQQIIDNFMDEYLEKGEIPFKKHLHERLGVTKNTLYRYQKQFPHLFETLNHKTQQMIVRHATSGKMKKDKALYLLIKNYDNKAIAGMIAEQIRFQSSDIHLAVLIEYGKSLGMKIQQNATP